ncbi:uncharacterized protein LOC143218237 [Lasioglossum baleicum]|uniref:uncharacterized protein LOC143218237 n=1 Tax=Lasioglossum baleicum TaxID=434251 RepID=UPI003FCC294B
MDNNTFEETIALDALTMQQIIHTPIKIKRYIYKKLGDPKRSRSLRQVAKTRLRKKLELENTIQKRAQTLENIRTLISTIEEIHTNTAVLSAYKTGSDVLKKLNGSGLSESKARDIMDDLAEALEEQKTERSTMYIIRHLQG